MLPYILLSVFALSALASNPAQSLLFPTPTSDNKSVGSVVGTASGLTTYAVACTHGDSSIFTTGMEMRMAGAMGA